MHDFMLCANENANSTRKSLIRIDEFYKQKLWLKSLWSKIWTLTSEEKLQAQP